MEPLQQSRVLGEETDEKVEVKDKDEEGDRTDHDRIAHPVNQQRTQ